MKELKIILMIVFSIISVTAMPHGRTDTIKVSGGNCAACKQQIEQAVKVEGVSKAEWDNKTQLLIFTYDTHKIKPDDIQKKLADGGYDTEKYKATDEAYNKLDTCCKYRSKQKTKVKGKKLKTKQSHSS